jgi:Tfp pilus assembly protein PilN
MKHVRRQRPDAWTIAAGEAMQQQINLFQPVFRREAKVFSARTLAQVLGLALVLSLAGVALLQLQLGRHNATRNLLDAQYRQLETRLQALEVQADAGQVAALDARILDLETRLADGAAELAQIRNLVIERSGGFSPLLEALARHPLDGLWLTGVRLADGELELHGRARHPELIPQYLAALGDDTALSAWPLAMVQVERETDPAGLLRFTLRSATPLATALREGR